MAYVVVFGLLVVLAILHELARRRVGVRLTAWRTVAIVGAVHYIVILVLLVAGVLAFGLPTGRAYTAIGELVPGYDAARVLRPRDRILAVDGDPLRTGTLSERVHASGGKVVRLLVERDDEQLVVEVQPTFNAQTQHWMLGIRPAFEHERSHQVRPSAILLAPVRGMTDIAATLERTFAGADAPDPGGPKRIYEEVLVRDEPAWGAAFSSFFGASGIAWLLQLVVDVVLALRARSRRTV